MKRHILEPCKGQRVMLPEDISRFGFRRKSQYYLFLLDYGQSVPNANLHEILLLPVSMDQSMVERLHSITVSIKNVPGATAAVVQCLADSNVDIKTCTATDSIAGNEGTLEACVVLPPEKTIDDLDKLVGQARSRLQVEDLIHERRSGEHGRRFVEGRSFFESRENITTLRDFAGMSKLPSVSRVAISKGECEQNSPTLDGSPCVKLPASVIDYINSSFERKEETDLDGLQAAITLDTEFSCISISILDPGDIILRTEFEVRDRKGAFQDITDFFGKAGVDFRIVELINITANERMLFRLVADYCQTEFTIYGLRTLSWVLFSQLYLSLNNRSLIDWPKSDAISKFRISAVHGYPRELFRFGPQDRFEIIDLWYVPDDDKHKLLSMGTSRMARECEAVGDTRPPHDPLIGKTLSGLLQKARNGPPEAFISRVVSAVTDLGFKKAEQEPFKDASELILNAVEDGQHIAAGIRLWLMSFNGGNLCLAFTNKPPSTLEGRIAELLSKPDKVVSNFDRACMYLVGGLDYKLPTPNEFREFGEASQEQFEKSSKERFGQLGPDYIKEKYDVDKFPINGNIALAKLVAKLLDSAPATDPEPFRMLDIGPGAGALTSQCVFRHSDALKRLHQNNRLRLELLDVSQEVLKVCKSGTANIPPELDEMLGEETDDARFEELLTSAETHEMTIAGLTPEEFQKLGQFDLVVSGFAHHHLSSKGREAACPAMARLTKPGGMVAIADECVTYKEYMEYRINHLRDDVDSATESFLESPEQHQELFDGVGLDPKKFETDRGRKWYAFAGVRKPSYFLCFSNENKKVVHAFKEIWDEIQGEADTTLWFDRRLARGDRIDEKIEAAIRGSRACVMFLSDDLLESKYVQEKEAPWIRKEVSAGNTKIFWVLADNLATDDGKIHDVADKKLFGGDAFVAQHRPLHDPQDEGPLAKLLKEDRTAFDNIVRKVVSALQEQTKVDS